MAENTKTLGRNQRVGIYVEGKGLSASWRNVLSWEWQREYYEGEDEYIGKQDVQPWQVPKASSGSFSIEETASGDVALIASAIDTAEQSGSRPDVKLVEYTDNNDGTTSKVTIPGVVMKYKKSNPGKGQKIKYDFSWRGRVPVESVA